MNILHIFPSAGFDRSITTPVLLGVLISWLFTESLGWVFAGLVVCDPPHQSAGQLRETLKLSAGAISMATATLVRMGVVERIAQAGERRAYYRFHPGGWERLMRSRLLATSQMRAIAEQALAGAPRPPERLAEMHEFYSWLETRMTELLSEPRGDAR